MTMSEWKEYKLGEILNLITKGTTPSHGVGFVEKGINYIKSDAIDYNGKLDKSRFAQIDSSTHEKFKRSQLAEDDILYSMAGIYLGKNAIVSKDVLPANTNQALAILRLNKVKAIPRYVSYYLSQPQIIDFVNNMSGQSAQPNINFEEIKSIEITLPPVPEQSLIANVLSSLDDKIDLLHRQNATLEAMAETLFRQWFVEEAKEDWDEGKLSDLVVVKYGKDHKKLFNGKIPVYGSGGIMRYADKALYNLESVLIPRKGTLSNVIYIDEPFWSVDTMFYTEMKKQNIAKFIFYFVKGLDLASMNVGSAVPSMTTELLNNLPIDIPSDVILKQFEQALAPLYKKMKSNQTQIRILTALRDTLLPKLMSGEVRVEM